MPATTMPHYNLQQGAYVPQPEETTTTAAMMTATAHKLSVIALTTLVVEVGQLLDRGQYGKAVMTFIARLEDLDPVMMNWIHEWLMVSIENGVMSVQSGPASFESHVELLGTLRLMYLACFGSDTGFTRILLRTADDLTVGNATYSRLLIFLGLMEYEERI